PKRLDRTPGARLGSIDPAPESWTRRGPAVVAVEPLTRDRASLPVDGRTHGGIVQEAEVDQGAQDVAIEAMHHAAIAVAPAEPSARSLRVLKDVSARTADAAVTRIGAHLVEEHQGPDRARVLRPVPRPRLHPVPRRLLTVEDRRDRRHAHRRGARTPD